MLLYICKTCGRWQDASPTAHLTNAANNLLRMANCEPLEPLPGFPCPAGHGLMVEVTADQRIYVRSGVVEAIVKEANT